MGAGFGCGSAFALGRMGEGVDGALGLVMGRETWTRRDVESGFARMWESAEWAWEAVSRSRSPDEVPSVLTDQREDGV